MEQGMDKYRAAREGANEIYFAVIATYHAGNRVSPNSPPGFVGRLIRIRDQRRAHHIALLLSLTPVLNIYLTSSNKNIPGFIG
jgi:hypothetical protein